MKSQYIVNPLCRNKKGRAIYATPLRKESKEEALNSSVIILIGTKIKIITSKKWHD
jgi:hypothetical protein